MRDLLAVRDLTVEFATDRGVAQVLDRISLAVAPGEVVGLVGESGCGKTTLARAILGILPRSGARIRGGEIEFKGRDLLRMDPGVVNDEVRGRAITFIPQDPWNSWSPLFTVGAQLMDLMKWKSPRIAEAAGPRPGAGPRSCASTRGRGVALTARRCSTSCARRRSPSPSARSGGCPTSSPEASGSGS